MPNYCYNHLTVTGDPARVKEFYKANLGYPAKFRRFDYEPEEPVESPGPKFLLNALVPVPKEVLDVGFDGSYRFRGIPFGSKEREKAEREAVLGGYNWCIENWGTKWEIWTNEIRDSTMGIPPELVKLTDDGKMDVKFITAWGPPGDWLKTAHTLFPDLCMRISYQEEDGAVGEIGYDSNGCQSEIFNEVRPYYGLFFDDEEEPERNPLCDKVTLEMEIEGPAGEYLFRTQIVFETEEGEEVQVYSTNTCWEELPGGKYRYRFAACNFGEIDDVIELSWFKPVKVILADRNVKPRVKKKLKVTSLNLVPVRDSTVAIWRYDVDNCKVC